jgi:hypothetical protein
MQIIGLVISHDGTHLLPEAVRILHSRLEYLPGLCDVPGLSHVSSIYRKIRKSNMLKVAQDILGIEEHATPKIVETPVKSKRQKREWKHAMSLIESSSKKTKPRNPFELLGQD